MSSVRFCAASLCLRFVFLRSRLGVEGLSWLFVIVDSPSLRIGTYSSFSRWTV